MENNNVKAFFEVLSKDEAVQKALKEKEIAYAVAKEYQQSIIEEVVIPVAKAAGYEFTLEDVLDLEKSMRPEGEMDENELEAVAGGQGFCVIIGIGVHDNLENAGFTACDGLGFGFGNV